MKPCRKIETVAKTMEEHLNHLTPKEFLDNFAGILTAFIQSIKEDDFSRPNKEIYAKQLKELLPVMYLMCMEPDGYSYFKDQSIPKMCVGHNITERDIYLINVIADLITTPIGIEILSDGSVPREEMFY